MTLPFIRYALLLACACAALEAAPPDVFLLHNARVVRVSVPVMPEADILIRNGIIEAVGAHLRVPADAWTIDATGLTVYPGFIDALSTWALPGAAPPATTARGTSAAQPAPPTPAIPAAPPAKGPEDRPLNASFYRAADHISATDAVIPTVRDAGFTTAVVFPTNNIFAGQGAIIQMAGDRPENMIVAQPAGQYLSMKTNGFSSFPGSLMGVIAYIRQIYLDAAHYQEARDIYAKHPQGLERPAYDHWLEGVLESPRALLPAHRAVEIDRVIQFSQELHLHAVLYGGEEAWRATAALKQSGMPVLVSLKWPERAKDADPQLEDPLRILEYRKKAPSSPAALAKAQIPFAFFSDGLTTPKDLRKNLKRALAAGLSEDDAVRALTLSAAEIYGVSDRLGSIDPGKIANLIVTSGNWFDDKSKVKFTFVDGKQYEPQPEEIKKDDNKKSDTPTNTAEGSRQ